jgi:hypothetical protein
MGYAERRRFCPHCDRPTLHYRDTVDGPPGLAFVGLLPFVFLFNLVAFPWTCMECPSPPIDDDD